MAQRPEGTVAFDAVLFTFTTLANTALRKPLDGNHSEILEDHKPESHNESSRYQKRSEVR